MKLYQNVHFQLGKCQVFSLSFFVVKNDWSTLDLRISLSKASLIYFFYLSVKCFRFNQAKSHGRKYI